MSWLLAAEADGAKEAPKLKKQKHDIGEEVAVKRLVHQLETRVRTLEHQNAVQLFVPKDHEILEVAKKVMKVYDAKVKEAGSGHKFGPPELQVLGGVLPACENWLSEESCPGQLKKYRGVCTRLMSMMQHADPEEVAGWVKEFTLSPTYDVGTVRITISMHGQILVGNNAEAAKVLDKIQSDAWGGVATDDTYEIILQRSPHEIPTIEKCKTVSVQSVMFQIMRGWGAAAKAGRAPRGALARRIKQ